MIVKTAKQYRKFTISPLPMLFVKTTGNGFTRNNVCECVCAVLAYPPKGQSISECHVTSLSQGLCRSTGRR